MTENTHIQVLSDLFTAWAGNAPDSVSILPASGSQRRYFRLFGRKGTAIGAYGSEPAENRAFFTIGKHLLKKGVNVPELYAVANDEQHYLIEDFGDTTLFSLLREHPASENVPLLQEAVKQLAFLQIRGGHDLDFSSCYPVASFDRISIFWDLNYFKYCFLKNSGIEIDELALERDFNYFAGHLLEADASFFMYRDFQSRNIMVQDGKLGFIDFQGGRRGPLQYDIVSFLFQAKNNFPENLRETLLQQYIETASAYATIDKDKFLRYYYSFALFRVLQVLGAYGFRGLVERKSHFLESIPFALQNVQWLLDKGKLHALQIPYLVKVLKQLIVNNPQLATAKGIASSYGGQAADILRVEIKSFAYKNGYPKDYSGNGGGYVFDCRGLNNPGRVPELREYNGRDRIIAEFLEQHSSVELFLQSVFNLLSLSVEDYLKRGFWHLPVSFGCTGGQHRSVYCAERTAAFLSQKYPKVQLRVIHRELSPS